MKNPLIQVSLGCMLMALFLTGKLSAQNLFGAKAGLNYSMINFYVDENNGNNGNGYDQFILNDWENKFGFELGIFLIRKRSARFSYQHQLYMNKVAFYQDWTKKSRYTSTRRQLHACAVYLNYSMMAQYHFLQKPNLFIKAGPYLGGKMITRAKGTIREWNEEPEDVNGDAHQYFPDVDLGLNIGIGTLLDLPNDHQLLLELMDNFRPRVSTLVFTVGYVFFSKNNRFQQGNTHSSD